MFLFISHKRRPSRTALNIANLEHADQVCVEGLGQVAAGLCGDGHVVHELPVPEVDHPETVVAASLY